VPGLPRLFAGLKTRGLRIVPVLEDKEREGLTARPPQERGKVLAAGICGLMTLGR
jgi:hypothetical protein